MLPPFWTTAEDDVEDPIGRRRRIMFTLVIGGIIGFLMAGVWGPGSTLGRETRGDAALGEKVYGHLRGNAGFRSLQVVEVDRAGVRDAGLGPDQGRWQAGGLTMTFTGHLLADAITRGEVRAEDTLATHLSELIGSPVGDLTLTEVATQRAGLPRLLPSESFRSVPAALFGIDPYAGTTPEKLLTEARDLSLENRGGYAHSQVGAALLGQALTRAARQPDWPTLARVRLFEPLGMGETTFATSRDLIPADAVRGHRPNGHGVRSSASSGAVAAGCCTWTTAADLGRYAQALLSGQVPGAEALEPLADGNGPSRVGHFWLVSPGPEGQSLTWQLGDTAGSSSFLALDRAAGRAVVVLSNTSQPVDRLGAGLIADDKPPGANPNPMDLLSALVLVAVVVWTVRRVLAATRRSQLVRAALDFASVVLLTALLADWVTVPGWFHGLALGVGAGALLLGLRRGRELPWAENHPKADRVQVITSAAVLIVVLVLIVA